MDTTKRQLLLVEENTRTPPKQWVFGNLERVDALDLDTRSRICLEVGQLSAYRHTLQLDGKSFRILNILELSASAAPPTTALPLQRA